MADYCPVASGLLAHPPEPQPKAELMQAIPAITPPPSPAQRALTLRNPKGEFLHWGCLKPLDSQAPFQNWFFARERDVYAIGAAASMDIRVREPVMRLHQCSLVWNGTDDRNAILIIDYSSSPHPDGLCTGTFVNRKRLEDGVPVVLRHGDEVRIYPTACMGPYEDLNFVFLQCTRRGWLPHRYRQYSWPPSSSEYWGLGEF